MRYPGQLIIPAPDPGHKFEFSPTTQAQSEQQTKFQQRKKISLNYGIDLYR